MTDDDKAAAEDYRQQRQATIARKFGVAPKTLDEQLQWMEDNKDLVPRHSDYDSLAESLG
jgi:hypothetical protein